MYSIIYYNYSIHTTVHMYRLLMYIYFLAVIMDTMTMHINPQYKLITMFYWSARFTCCLQKSTVKSLSRKYSASNGLAAKGLHFSHPHQKLSIERDLTLLSIGVAAYA